MTTPSLATEAAKAGRYPSRHFNKRERKLLASAKAYVDGISELSVITTQGDLVIGNASNVPARLAIGSAGLPLTSNGTTAAYTALAAAGLASNAVTTAKILDANVTLGKLAAGITPSHVVKFAGKHTTAGGAAAEAWTVTGVASTDIVLITLQAQGITPRTVLFAAPTTDTLTVTFSGDPSTDHVISYMVLRAAA